MSDTTATLVMFAAGLFGGALVGVGAIAIIRWRDTRWVRKQRARSRGR